ncbi:methionine adenosyltransferase domain-containing protein [Candidatus Uhrbacteria bacterium]|nr:methionine adenosyltransferase domain-containing protein [Candidatus Uhrbacteria bacterium]
MVKTCEFVTPKHPDKMCDGIVDNLLDAYIAQDPTSRVALEAMGGHGVINVSGEVTSSATVDVKEIVKALVGDAFVINSTISQQSPEIAQGVDIGGAGDQGIMKGYACSETESRMPREYELARNLCKKLYEQYPYDGKVQVTINGEKVIAVVASFQNSKNDELSTLVRSIIQADEYYINPAGEWNMGGFDADSGLSGRKLIIDNYGPEVTIGGGSFSGKDYTKVDRSGAYMARKIAVDYLKKYQASEVFVKLAYAIGRAEPLMRVAVVDGKEIQITDYDVRPQGIKNFLQLDRPIYAQTASWGHFGNGFAWDI